jgi:ATP-binding cassette, subfamily B, bacterial MsbA
MIGRFKSMRLSPALESLWELSGNRVRLLPLMVLISMLAFVFEGLAIYLIFPLIEILAGNDPANTVKGPLGWLGGAVSTLPASQRVAAVVAVIVGCILIKSIIAFIGTALFSNTTQQIGNDVRRKSFAQVLAASPLFLGSRPAGAIMNTLTRQTWAVSEGLEKFAYLLMSASAVVVFLVLLIKVSSSATLVIFVGVLICIAAATLINRIATRMGRKAVEANEDLTVRMLEGLTGQTTLRLFNGEAQANAEFGASSDRTRRTLYRLSLVSAMPQLFLEVLFAAIIGIVLVFSQQGNVGEVLVLIALLFRMQPHAIALVHARAILASIVGAVENLENLRDATAATSEVLGLPAAPPLRSALSLSRVGFSYPILDDATDDEPESTLVDITFTIPAGKVTALVGHSGAGKSTLAMLLCRLTEPDTGQILVDGTELAGYDAASWRNRCAFVPQNVFLFNRSILENIQIGRPDATNADIENAAREANAHDFIRALPQGYETCVGDRGDNLSGGQRQRIALARAFLRQPDLLILDEATNALDPRSEQLVSDALSVNDRKRTTIVIAHRLSTIQRADQVIVLEQGRIVEIGTPRSLSTKSGGHFAKLFENEMEWV